jgi:hypothetical protein
VRLDTGGKVLRVRGRAIAGVVALGMLASSTAQAADVTARGSIVVRWASNAQTCGTFGLCGRSGALSWRPQSGGYETLAGGKGANLSFYEAPAIARSRRETEAGPRVCIEEAGGPFELSAIAARASKLVRLTMGDVPGLSFGRCAGPLPADFADALPRSARFNPARIARRGGTIDMRGRAPFAAGPFNGEVVSSLRFRITPARNEEATAAGARAARAQRFSSIKLVYAIDRIDGAMTLGFAGTSDATCEIFDVCGLHGELAVGGTSMPGIVEIHAGRDLRPGQRLTKDEALRALRAGRIPGFADVAFGSEDDRAEYPPPHADLDFTERSRLPGSPECVDGGKLQIDRLDAGSTRTGFRVTLGTGNDEPPNDLRTHCPGPEAYELRSPIAEGTLPWKVLGDERIGVNLAPGRGLRSVAFTGAWRGQYDVLLRRISVEVETRSVRIPEDG